ncbi:hypothetical protein MJO28_016040 [Puccinia striiformis f. sp. tritici]|uniref:Uncharacterized protein n=1 Tax=Puccinia striiformis f. sp. tritici TaxID=168172 RepID=A0ACC0DQQ1_9BASI|nr:hypothetical protein MJO28_016040 [Puccinia striiformis f. sp. tritici]
MRHAACAPSPDYSRTVPQMDCESDPRLGDPPSANFFLASKPFLFFEVDYLDGLFARVTPFNACKLK